ncbi:peptidase C45 [Halobacillus litoralis]|uniref:Peptidase C45 n=1 Tax=Halobacillus litoralis TaxID=45668 RepID=A0A845F9U6_9BACI|nr:MULTISPECIES: C45 family peptidase [Halobacillus]MEC3885935.1 C45 family peptidase [Halobacillus sp. HZG1]MYL71122.1 peptidase C45 [Halobacillus litoralis]
MKPFFSQLIAFRGRHDDFGYVQGERLKRTLLYKHHEQRRKRSKLRYDVDIKVVKEQMDFYCKGLFEELRGLAEGLQWPLAEVIHEYSGYQQDWEGSGCSILTGNGYFARNYDYHPTTYEGRLVLFQPKDGYASIGPSQRIIGRTDGMNEHGLCIGYNFVNRIHPGDGFICCLLTRMVLETCKTTREAVHLLKKLPHRHSFNYVVFDAGGTSKIIEGSPRGVSVKEGTACTNHFTEMAKENRRHLSDTHERLDDLKSRQAYVLNGLEAFHLLNDSYGPIFSHGYKQWSGTIHTACYSPASLTLHFGLGGDTVPSRISFKDWLNGSPSLPGRIHGALDTDETIPYMDTPSF